MGSQQEDYEEVTEEVFARRAQARQRQITIGKSRPEYKIYVGSVSFHRRSENMPHTPDPHARISKRAFDRELACWRRGLHVCSSQFDDSSGNSPASQVRSECGEERALPVVELGQKWADFSPTGKDWSPANTESTRAESEASSPTPPGAQSKAMWNAASNVKLNLFEHLSPPVPPPAPPLAAGTSFTAPAMPQMMPAMPAPGAWEMYPTEFNGVNATSMPGMDPSGQMMDPSGQMLQFAPVEQQSFNGGYAMPYGWGEPMADWGQQTAPQFEPLPALGQLPAPLAAPIQPSADVTGMLEMPKQPQQLTWPPPSPQQRLPGTPRVSKSESLDDTPSTPLNRVVRSAASPFVAPTSPWLRTPSPDHAHYNMNSFKAAQPSQAPSVVEADPWVGTTLMVATRSYLAELEGYLSVGVGSQVRAMIDNPHQGGSDCAWPTYVYCCQGDGATGWVPQQLLWRCFVDEAGRRWACDDATGTWCWVDEMEKNS